MTSYIRHAAVAAAFTALLLTQMACAQTNWTVASPDGQIAIRVSLAETRTNFSMMSPAASRRGVPVPAGHQPQGPELRGRPEVRRGRRRQDHRRDLHDDVRQTKDLPQLRQRADPGLPERRRRQGRADRAGVQRRRRLPLPLPRAEPGQIHRDRRIHRFSPARRRQGLGPSLRQAHEVLAGLRDLLRQRRRTSAQPPRTRPAGRSPCWPARPTAAAGSC